MTEQTLDEVTGDTITLDGTGTDAIILPELPVNGAGTVNMIGCDGGTTAVTNYALKGNGVLLRTRGSAAEEEDYVETAGRSAARTCKSPTTTAMTRCLRICVSWR